MAQVKEDSPGDISDRIHFDFDDNNQELIRKLNNKPDNNEDDEDMEEDAEETDIRFVKYPSILNVKAAKKKKDIAKLNDLGWVLQEKIHGANFQIIVYREEDGSLVVKFASRNRILPKGDAQSTIKELDFFDYSHLIEPITKAATNLWDMLSIKEQLNIYGELYGGNIQREIKYSDKIQFKVFDVLSDRKKWMDYEELEKVVPTAGFKTVPIKMKGTIEELCNQSSEFTSDWSEHSENAEGNVVKIIIDGCKFAIKCKAPSFTEKHTGKKTTQVEVNFAKMRIKHVQLKEEEIGRYLTTHRLATVYSKRGPPTKETKLGEVAKELAFDIIKDYTEDLNTDAGNELTNSTTAKKTVFGSFAGIHQFVINDFESRQVEQVTESMDKLSM
jgi:Rnl2 family RNA ligase